MSAWRTPRLQPRRVSQANVSDVSAGGIGSEIASRLRDGTFKKCVAKCPGGASTRGGEGRGGANEVEGRRA